MENASCLAAAVVILFGFGLPNIPAARGAGFGLVERGGVHVVDTGAELVFEVSRRNGDLVSIKFRGRECAAPYAKTHRHGHYASGLSRDSKITAERTVDGQWIKIAIDDARIGVTHYYLARRGENDIYMATYAEKSPPPGEMRFITYLDRGVFTNLPVPSDVARGDVVLEGKDVFKDSKTGATYSKFYGASPIIEGGVRGVSGEGIACFMDMGNRETSSGGPFFRDIENQSTANASELYNYMFSGHTQTESFRPGLKGPYALQFTDGGAPVPPDFTALEKLGLKGWVPAAARGRLAGRVEGVRPGNRATVALANATAQYWAEPDPTGRYAIARVVPGEYVATLYDVELAVATRRVTIKAGGTATADLTATLRIPPAIFRIGTWDGTPRGFLNADAIADRHPGDARMKPFRNGNFVVGRSRDADWPLGQWKGVNNDQRVTFELTAGRAAAPLTLRIGVTLTYAGGRPRIEVNAGTPLAWKSSLPEPSNQPRRSRGVTRGTYRGNNDVFSYDIPQSALREGSNTIDIHIESGSRSTGSFLDPNVVYDAVDLVPTTEIRE